MWFDITLISHTWPTGNVESSASKIEKRSCSNTVGDSKYVSYAQVAPSFTTENGIVRVQIRHPSSPLFPKPIGWVTQDASAAGGPKFLEPGPEPMKTSGAFVFLGDCFYGT